MEKIFRSKLFVIIIPIIVLAIGIAAGTLLGLHPKIVAGYTTATTYVFRIKTAIGYWLLALILSIITTLLCVIIRKQYINKSEI